MNVNQKTHTHFNFTSVTSKQLYEHGIKCSAQFLEFLKDYQLETQNWGLPLEITAFRELPQFHWNFWLLQKYHLEMTREVE